MDFRNCPRCGKIFQQISSPFCPSCEREEEEMFQKIKDYIEKNPEHNLSTIAEETGVSERRILFYIREGRLIVSKGLMGIITCEKCGEPISTGRYCDNCIIKLNQEVEGLYPNKNKGVKMHTADMHKDRRKRFY